jgi:hypothetical protein
MESHFLEGISAELAEDVVTLDGNGIQLLATSRDVGEDSLHLVEIGSKDLAHESRSSLLLAGAVRTRSPRRGRSAGTGALLENPLQVPSRLPDEDGLRCLFLDKSDFIECAGTGELAGLVDQGIDLARVLTPAVEVQAAEDLLGVYGERNIVQDSHAEIVPSRCILAEEVVWRGPSGRSKRPRFPNAKRRVFSRRTNAAKEEDRQGIG